MKTAYTPDNTRSSIVILLALAVIVSVVAAVIGLSEKPEVATIVISPNGNTSIVATLSANSFGSEADEADDRGDDVLLDETGEPFDDAQAETASTEASRTPEGQVIVVPTSEPTPTPEVAAAVEPTSVPEQSDNSAEAAGAVQAAPRAACHDLRLRPAGGRP